MDKILVATTCTGSFQKHLTGLVKSVNAIDYDIIELFISEPDLPFFPETPGEIINNAGRWITISEAKKQKADWILFVDADIRVDPDVIKEFLKHKYPFVAGALSARDDPNRCIGHIWIDKATNNSKYLTKEYLTKPRIVDSMGGGLMMVHRDIFEKLDLSLYKGPQEYDIPYMGGDMFFAEQAYEKTGFKPMIIPEVTAWHLYRGQKSRLWGRQEFFEKK